MTVTQDVKQKAIDVGFVSVGISNPSVLRDLPYGGISNVYNLRSPEDELPTVRSVILMRYYAWDSAFNLRVDSTYFQSRETHVPKIPLESYQLYYEVMKSKAWMLVDYLRQKGFEAILSLTIPLKTAAVKCGLGCQGKSTLLITPTYGPRVRVISVLTTAELDIDEPYREDLCKECEKCVTACPTGALEPYKLRINRCMTYAAEQPEASDVPDDVRTLERRLIRRPTPHSYIECTTCIEACPIGKLQRTH